MKNKFISCLIVAVVVVALSMPALAGNGPPVVGDALPEMVFPVPQNASHREYLGLEEGGTFSIPQIDAQVVIIEIFSMYCPHCQREAPTVNGFYAKIQNDGSLKGRVKMIGIGVGNSEFEVGVFRKKYNISFPLFADADFSAHKKLGEVRTPYFIGIKIADDRNHRVFYSQLGGPHDARGFLEKMLQQAGQ
ncbi:MAG: TlpA disulfide reductase family protein [Thermodesulfobacteriota bacterium]